jgi:hypothetical protein
MKITNKLDSAAGTLEHFGGKRLALLHIPSFLTGQAWDKLHYYSGDVVDESVFLFYDGKPANTGLFAEDLADCGIGWV